MTCGNPGTNVVARYGKPDEGTAASNNAEGGVLGGPKWGAARFVHVRARVAPARASTARSVALPAAHSAHSTLLYGF